MKKEELPALREYYLAMAEAESAVASFYRACFEFWPDEEIWKELAGQETGHSETVLKILAALEAAPEKFTLLRPANARAVRLFTEGARAAEARVRAMTFKKLTALSASRDLEQSIIEARYDQLLSGAAPAVNALLDGIVAETRTHRAKIAARLATLAIVK